MNVFEKIREEVGTTSVDYADLAPVLDAGYRASLRCGDVETMHFAVIKTNRQMEAASRVVVPFRMLWERCHPGSDPTAIILCVNPNAVKPVPSEDFPAGLSPDAHCSRVMREMSRTARERGLAACGRIRLSDLERCEAAQFSRAWGKELLIPGMYVPAGVFGVAYSDQLART